MATTSCTQSIQKEKQSLSSSQKDFNNNQFYSSEHTLNSINQLRTPPLSPSSMLNVPRLSVRICKEVKPTISKVIECLFTTPIQMKHSRPLSHLFDIYSDGCISPLIERQNSDLSSSHWSESSVMHQIGRPVNLRSADISQQSCGHISRDNGWIPFDYNLLNPETIVFDSISSQNSVSSPVCTNTYTSTNEGVTHITPTTSQVLQLNQESICTESYRPINPVIVKDISGHTTVHKIPSVEKYSLSPITSIETSYEQSNSLPLIQHDAEYSAPISFEELVAPELTEAVSNVHDFVAFVTFTLFFGSVLRLIPWRVPSTYESISVTSQVSPKPTLHDFIITDTQTCTVYPGDESCVEYRFVWSDVLMPMLLLTSFVVMIFNKITVEEAAVHPDLMTRMESIQLLLRLQLTVAYALLVLMVMCVVFL